MDTHLQEFLQSLPSVTRKAIDESINHAVAMVAAKNKVIMHILQHATAVLRFGCKQVHTACFL